MYEWGGKPRRVPETFKLPVGNVHTTWLQWCLGSSDPTNAYPPLRRLECLDMGDDKVPEQRNKRRKLSDLRGLMGTMEQVCLAISLSLSRVFCCSD